MARIANVVIPDEKQIQISLTYVFGIGPKHAASILEATKIEPTTRVKDLTEAELKKIRDEVDSNFVVEGDLQRVVAGNVKRLKDIQAYRGIRHKNNLPSRGQRTRTNGRTRRGKRVAIGGSQPKSATKT
jgi:small subunit ribosomal protein S13